MIQASGSTFGRHLLPAVACLCLGVVATLALIDLDPFFQGGPASTGLPGMTLAPASAGHGLTVTSLGGDGAAVRGGVRVGDLLEAVDGRPVDSDDALADALRDGHSSRLTLRFRRGEAAYQLILHRQDER